MTQKIQMFNLIIALSKGTSLPFEANRVKPGVTPMPGFFVLNRVELSMGFLPANGAGATFGCRNDSGDGDELKYLSWDMGFLLPLVVEMTAELEGDSPRKRGRHYLRLSK